MNPNEQTIEPTTETTPEVDWLCMCDRCGGAGEVFFCRWHDHGCCPCGHVSTCSECHGAGMVPDE